MFRKDKRQHRRIRVLFLLRYVPEGSKREPGMANIKDISPGGLLFWTDRIVHKGEDLKVEILVPTRAKTIEAVAQVVRMHHFRAVRRGAIYHVAAKFKKISEEDKTYLQSIADR